MPKFTIEMTYHVPHYRHTTYEAATLEDALELAKQDQNWDHQKEDWETCTIEEVTGAWRGEDAYDGESLV